MKKFIAVTAAFVVIFALLRRFGPALRKEAEAKCQEMMTRHRKDAGAAASEPTAALRDPATSAAA